MHIASSCPAFHPPVPRISSPQGCSQASADTGDCPNPGAKVMFMSPNNRVSTYELGLLVLSDDPGPWREMGECLFAPRKARQGPKSTWTAQPPTHPSQEGDSPAHVRCLLLGWVTQGLCAGSCWEDASICIAYATPHPLHST